MLSTTWTKRTIRSESLQPLGGGRMKTEAIAPGIPAGQVSVLHAKVIPKEE